MRQIVVEIQCARCERKETRKYSGEGGPDDLPATFFAKLYGEDSKAIDVKFDDLCSPCLRSVKSLLEQIGKRIDGLSPDRVAKPRAETRAKKEESAPTAPTPRAQQVAPAKPAAAVRSS